VNKFLIVILFSTAFIGSPAMADSAKPKAGDSATFEGKVRGTGGGINYRTHIITDDKSVKPRLCNSDINKRIFKLSGMRVSVAGSWKLRSKKKKKLCFDASEFTLLKGSSGKSLVVGTLEKTEAGYKIDGGSGKPLSMSQVPSGLRDLVGKKVFVEVNAMKGPTESESTKIVSYGEYP